MAKLYPLVEVIGITTTYTVERARARVLLDSGRATQLDQSTIQLVGNTKRHNRREWVKKRSGPVSTMQLVDVRKVRPRHKPKHIEV